MTNEELKNLVKLYFGDIAVFHTLYKSLAPNDTEIINTARDMMREKEITMTDFNHLILFIQCRQISPHLFN
jgi:hypothetical protein